MYKPITGIPGVIGMLQIHGNGFYTPSDEVLLKFIKPKANCIVDLQEVTYPFELVLIGYQSDDKQCFKEFIVAHNANQVRYLYNNVVKYAAIIPKSCLNDIGLELCYDHIMTYDQSSEFNKIL